MTMDEFLKNISGKFGGNILNVNVDSSAWLYQLSNKKKELAAKAGIPNINFRIGEIK